MTATSAAYKVLGRTFNTEVSLETYAIAYLLLFTTLPYAIGIAMSVFRDSPIPLIAAMLFQRVGFIVFLAIVTSNLMGKSGLSGISVLGGFLLILATSSLVMKPFMHTLMQYLLEQRRMRESAMAAPDEATTQAPPETTKSAQ